MTTKPQPLTDHRLDEIEARWAHVPRSEDARLSVTDSSSPGVLLAALSNAPEDVPALLDEIRHLRAQLAAVRSDAIASAADVVDVVDAKLAAEPDHNRASALYELLLQLRGELPCTCARTGGLHAKDCGKYVPGHELLSRHNALARYRAERPATPVV